MKNSRREIKMLKRAILGVRQLVPGLLSSVEIVTVSHNRNLYPR